MAQFSEHIDNTLNRLSNEIKFAKDTIAEQTGKHDAAWTEAFDLFDELGLEGKEARFLAKNGHTLHRSRREGSPSLDEKLLQQKLEEKFGPLKAKRIWNTLVIGHVDSRLLEVAVLQGRIPQSIVDECLTPGKETFSRLFPEWTKEDRERAEILGIRKDD